MTGPSQAIIDKMWAFARKYAAKSGTSLHPDRSVTEAVVGGLATNIEQVGRRGLGRVLEQQRGAGEP